MFRKLASLLFLAGAGLSAGCISLVDLGRTPLDNGEVRNSVSVLNVHWDQGAVIRAWETGSPANKKAGLLQVYSWTEYPNPLTARGYRDLMNPGDPSALSVGDIRRHFDASLQSIEDPNERVRMQKLTQSLLADLERRRREEEARQAAGAAAP